MKTTWLLVVSLFCFCSFCLVVPSSLTAQTAKDTLRFRIMTYNVENLFDCRHDSLKEDTEFLPDGIRHWTLRRYHKKLDNIARVIAAVGGWQPPALVALQEVENDTVLCDLTQHTPLRSAGYRYVMTHSSDRRGIDVALLYQREWFKLLYARSIVVPTTNGRQTFRPTRDILHVGGRLLSGDTLDVFVCHFPSRAGGARQTEPYRRLAVKQLVGLVDSLYSHREHPQLLIMGDFNAPCSLLQSPRLHHLLEANKEVRRRHTGSYRYQGRWELIDHLIVSANMLAVDASLHADDAHASLFEASFLLREDKHYGSRQPLRTYTGRLYEGGFSDHLPEQAELTLLY